MPTRSRTDLSPYRCASLLVALMLPLGVGCALAPDEPVEEDALNIGESTAAIVGGNPTTGYPAVPLLYAELGGGPRDPAQICSGTLISPRVILTAAHCVEFATAPTTYRAYFGSNAIAQQDPQFRGSVDIVDYVFHPDWDIDDLEAGNDIGLVLLESPGPVQPMPYNRTSIDGRVGDQVHLVGWGRTSGEGEDVGVKREVMSSLQAARPKLMQYGSAGANTCQGDSGGPNFMTVNGVEVVAGITSFGNEGCDLYGFGTRVDVFAESFIDPYIVQNDPSAPLPGGSDPGGEPGGSDPGAGSSQVTGGCSAGAVASSGQGAAAVTLLVLAAFALGVNTWRRRFVRVASDRRFRI